MSATGKPEDWDQPNGLCSLNLDDIFLTGLGETHEQGLSNEDFLGNSENLQQGFNPDTYNEAHDSGYQELSAASQSFVPTPSGSLPLDETPNESGDTYSQWYWESEDVASGADFPMEAHEMQPENPTPSTSNTVVGLREQKKGYRKRKREESPGECDECEMEFSRKSDAKRHRRTVHSRNGDFSCNRCGHGKTFTRKDALQRHMKAKHDSEEMT